VCRGEDRQAAHLTKRPATRAGQAAERKMTHEGSTRSDVNPRLISLVVPMYNEAQVLDELFERLVAVLTPLQRYRFEVVCVNDGSRDTTLEALLRKCEELSFLRVIDLSRNFGKEAALSAGISEARGDAVIPLDADLQDPPELIEAMLEKWEAGAEVVIAHRINRDSDGFLKRLTAKYFYRVHNALSEPTIPENVGDFRLMDRRVVDVLLSLPESRRFMKGLFAWVGFRTETLGYERRPRAAGDTKFSGWKLWNLALEGITSFSTVPLRAWSYFGGAVALVALIYGLFLMARTLLFGVDLPGYSSLMTAVLFLGGVQLIGIGVLGEYVGRIYVESKRRPAFVVRARYSGESPIKRAHSTASANRSPNAMTERSSNSLVK
jgi:glycosyltransferase involved in cell wall biosynthesis